MTQFHLWLQDVKVDVEETGWEGVCLIHQNLDRIYLAGFCEHGNEPSSAIKCKEFLHQLRNYQLLTRNSAPPSQQHPCYPRTPFGSKKRYLIYVVLLSVHSSLSSTRYTSRCATITTSLTPYKLRTSTTQNEHNANSFSYFPLVQTI
jgi:hypothetical protein